MKMTPKQASELKDMLPLGQFSFASEVLHEHSSDRWHASRLPDAVVFPESAKEVSLLLQFAARHDIPITARGGGVGYVGGCVPVQGGIALSLSRMNRIREIHAHDGVAVVEPGVITGDLQEAARRKGLFYPPDPASLKECTIGGNIATNAGGPRCLKYGVTRNYILGLEVVLADGGIVRCGSRCHKNKTGLDLVGLFVGSEGMLGIVTQATLRLLPLPPFLSMLLASFPSYQAASEAVQRILAAGFLPSALEIADKFTLEAARKHLSSDLVPDGEAILIVELDGQEAAVRLEAELLGKVLRSSLATHIDIAHGEQDCERMWNVRRAFSYSLKSTGLIKLNEDIVVPRSRLIDLARFTEELQARTGIAIACFGHAGDGNIHVNLMVEEMDSPESQFKVDEALDQLFRQVMDWGGVLSGEHGIGLAKMPWFRQAIGPEAMSLHQRLKDALDPARLLNPGKMWSPENP